MIRLLSADDLIIARKHSEPQIEYVGEIIEIKTNVLILVRFKENFVATFDHTDYMIKFDFLRPSWIRQHYGIDLAYKIFGIEILLPKVLTKREKPLFDVHLDENDQLKLKDRPSVGWFNQTLNENQKEAIVNIMRGEYVNPYLIYGPPGKKQFHFINMRLTSSKQYAIANIFISI